MGGINESFEEEKILPYTEPHVDPRADSLEIPKSDDEDDDDEEFGSGEYSPNR